MLKTALCCVAILALVAAATPARAEQAAKDKRVSRGAASQPNCEARIEKLEASDVQGAERLAENNEVIDHCASQYKRDKTIDRLVKECGKYYEQPVLKQLFVTECMLAAFKYANALQALKAEYRK